MEQAGARPLYGTRAHPGTGHGTLWCMGAHSEETQAQPGTVTTGLEVVHLQAYTVAAATQIICWGTYSTATGKTARHVGSVLVNYDLLHLPAMGQVIYALGDELKGRWAGFGRAPRR